MTSINLIRYEKGKKVAEFETNAYNLVPHSQMVDIVASGLKYHIVTRYMLKEGGVQWVLRLS
jgi:hypothetical protein